MTTSFHLALPSNKLEETREFYVDVLGAKTGRSTERWLDIDLYGHQITFARAGVYNFDYKNYRFEDYVLPAFHFGLIIPGEQWQKIYSRLSKLDLEITTQATFLENQTGEHLSFFVQDPNGFMVEFKSFKNSQDIFTK